jgi:hypothetical protein
MGSRTTTRRRVISLVVLGLVLVVGLVATCDRLGAVDRVSGSAEEEQ